MNSRTPHFFPVGIFMVDARDSCLFYPICVQLDDRTAKHKRFFNQTAQLFSDECKLINLKCLKERGCNIWLTARVHLKIII